MIHWKKSENMLKCLLKFNLIVCSCLITYIIILLIFSESGSSDSVWARRTIVPDQ